MKPPIRAALVGNPNAGKTTLFNAMTGARQRVGNYPGVTVERRSGHCRFDHVEIELVDLPGTYSLSAYSTEERIARDAILGGEVDVVVDVVDASNLDRNLYLTTQLLELDKPVVVALNMSDVARANGIEPDIARLEERLGVPVMKTVGHRGQGVDDVLREAVRLARNPSACRPPRLHYGPAVDEALDALTARIEALPAQSRPPYPARWTALKLLEEDEVVAERVADPALHEEARRAAERVAGRAGDRVEAVTADGRYRFISSVCPAALRQAPQMRYTVSDRIDAVVTHGWLGIPIFLLLMFLVFRFTFVLGEPLMGMLEWLFQRLGDTVSGLWPAHSPSLLRSLLVDGVIGGVGGVIAFLPNILLLFFAISLLEDSGYMARAAFVTDALMRRIGLQGRSFIPMLLGFGCSVPGVMATRTIEQDEARWTTILVLPLMSCGARLTVYLLLIPAFFPPRWYTRVLWLVYVTGIAAAIGLARLLRATWLRGETAPLAIELPPYRWPSLRGALHRMGNQAGLYVRKAGTIILSTSIVLWALTVFPRPSSLARDYAAKTAAAQARYEAAAAALFATAGMDDPRKDAAFQKLLQHLRAAQAPKKEQGAVRALDEGGRDSRLESAARDARLAAQRAENPARFDLAMRYLTEAREPFEAEMQRLDVERRMEEIAQSWAGRIGRRLEPAMRPLGFDWRIGTALVGAVAAKEVFVAQMGVLLSVGEENGVTLRERLRAEYTPLTGISLLLFCLLSPPCIATLAVTRQEIGHWRWPALQFAGLTALAYLVSLAVYQIGGLGWS